MDTTLVIMAAGMGSRYGGLKQIEPVGGHGEMIIDYTVYDAIRAGFSSVVFIIRRDIEDTFREKIGSRIGKRIATRYAYQELDALPDGFAVPAGRVKPWGTGHAVLCAADAVSGPFGVVNADDFYGAGAFSLLNAFLSSAADASTYCMVGYPIANTLSEHGHVSRGECAATADGFLSSVVERSKIQRKDGAIRYVAGDQWREMPEETVVSMNVWGFTASLMAELSARFAAFLEKNGNESAEFYLPGVVNDLINEKKVRVKVFSSPDRWYGITYREDLPIIRGAIGRMVREGVYPDRLWG